MNTPDFNLRPVVFSEDEKALLKEVTTKVEKACINCEDCDWCIFTKFCRQVNLNGDTTSPGELLTEIFSMLGVDFN